MAKAIGVGGVFFKAKAPKELAAWYSKHLGVELEHGALIFKGSGPESQTVVSTFAADTSYFGDGPQGFMVDFVVDDLDGLLEQLAADGVRIDPKREDHPYGRFAWIWDPEGNRVELWQAVEEG